MTAGRTDPDKDSPVVSPAGPRKGGPFFLIAVGASGQHTDALIRLLDSAPASFTPSFIIATTDDGIDAVALTEKLDANCKLTVLQIATGTEVVPGRVFVCPPGATVRVVTDTSSVDGPPDFRFEIQNDTTTPGQNSPLDTLMSSVAATFGEFAVGILLSGLGNDGGLGLREIKRRDGFVMLEEDTGSKEFTPRSLMLSGLVDRIGRPEKMLDALAQVMALRRTFVDEASVLLHPYRESFERLLQVVTGTSQIDFTRFKRPALQRRILRRMALCKCETLPEYISYISRSWEEVGILQNEFLVGVTSFFRDPDTWEALVDVLLPRLFRDDAGSGRQVKIWCAACSTGEEAYSLALVCHDYRMRHGLERDFRIYATDLKVSSLDEAKRGIYPHAALAEIPSRYVRPELLTIKGNTFEFDPLLQRQVVFSRHDMIKDQPFTQCDLIVCRNALIYYNQETQKLLLDRFSGALRPGGALFLGAPEISTAHGSAFRPMRGTNRFLENTREERIDEAERALPPRAERNEAEQGRRLSHLRQDSVASEVIAEMPDILRHLGAAVFVLNEDGEIQRTFGNYDRFVKMPRARTFSSNLLDLLPEALSVNVALLMRKAAAAGKAKMPPMEIGEDVPPRQVEGLCQITSSPDDQTTYIVTLNDRADAAAADTGTGTDDATQANGHDATDQALLKAEIASLHDKLAATFQDLQDIYAERQVMEARLRQAEDELADSQQEIGNLTRELHSVRSGSGAPDDFADFLFGEVADVLTQLDLGVAFVTRQLRLTQFNETFGQLLSLGAKHLGRQIDELTHHLPQADRQAFNKALLQSALHEKPAVFDVEGRDGLRYKVHARPLSDLTTMGDGVVLLTSPLPS